MGRPVKKYIITAEQLNRMTLTELNAEIKRLGKLANQRIARLESYSGTGQGIKETVLPHVYVTIGVSTPSPSGIATRFSTRAERGQGAVGRARSRLGDILRVMNYATITPTGIRREEERRISRMSEYIGKPLTRDEFDMIVHAIDEVCELGPLYDDLKAMLKQEARAGHFHFSSAEDVVEFVKWQASRGKSAEITMKTRPAEASYTWNASTHRLERRR